MPGKCKVCSEPADGIVDCVGVIANGGWYSLCGLCMKINDLFWDLSLIRLQLILAMEGTKNV